MAGNYNGERKVAMEQSIFQDILAGAIGGGIATLAIGGLAFLGKFLWEGGLVKLLGGATKKEMEELAYRLDRDDEKIVRLLLDLVEPLGISNNPEIQKELEELKRKLKELEQK